MTALPWVLLGRRVAYQPHLDASSAQLVLGMSPKIPGQLLSHPGPPLNTIQLKGLLDQLYRFHDRPAVPMSGKRETFDIDNTLNATHVYVKVDNPQSLCPNFEGPYEIYSRPSSSQIEVRIGSFKDGRPRLLKFHWSSCKIAHLREGSAVASRPALGRKPRSSLLDASSSTDAENVVVMPPTGLTTTHPQSPSAVETNLTTRNENITNKQPAKIQTHNSTNHRPIRL